MSTLTLGAKQAFLLERWKQILEDPELDKYDHDHRFETDAEGNVLMSPRAKKDHNYKASEIGRIIVEHLGGSMSTEAPIATYSGIKVPDVCWLDAARHAEFLDPDPFTVAPEICVEVLSPKNTRSAIDTKRALYFETGAREVWICDRDNAMTFYDPNGLMQKSKLCPDFPAKLHLAPAPPPQPKQPSKA